MAMSITLREYLDTIGMQYDLVPHSHTSCSIDTAKAAHISISSLAKSVVVEDNQGCMTVVIPASRYVELAVLDDLLDRDFYLAPEEELIDLFDDCERGAIPAAAQAFGMQVLVDERLFDCEDVYFEAGDHAELVHMSGEEFESLMALAGHGQFSRSA